MLEEYSMQYYGPQDGATKDYLSLLVEDISRNDSFGKRLVRIIENSDSGIEYYKNLLKLRVILQYKELMSSIESESVLEVLEKFYRDLDNNEINTKSINLNIKSYLNTHVKSVFQYGDHLVIEETIRFCLRFSGGISNWDQILINSHRDYLIRHFADLFRVLRKKDENIKTLINLSLFPISRINFDCQMDIALSIRRKFESEFSVYQQSLFDYFESREFNEQNSANQVNQIKGVLSKRFLGIKGEIYLKGKLETAEQKMQIDLQGNMYAYKISAQEFSDLESTYSDFREKLYLLTFRGVNSIYKVMQRQSTKANSVNLLDLIGTLDGIPHEKYGKAGFAMRFQNYTSLIYVNTMYLIHHHELKFWESLRELVCDVAELSGGIGLFLIEDLNKLERLFNSKEYFLTSTFMVQILERLLREIYLKIEFGIVDVLREAKYQLGTILKTHEGSVLRKLFAEEEIETMDYFLVNDEYGWNLRNRLAHYNIDSSDISEQHCIQLIHIMIFILIKIDYEGVIFEKTSFR
ncbi:DUF4209 domain-containing protein [Exiguobacterium sp. ERU656]|uniref:DUF4209 domain-containing protein n=1 Tax=Exiguobacterium sp. ERU656 TaxID=2751217 RepID=UPI001BED17D0|nr:DUF4209 domain-containing protein [Exiguobacterium sp. ERU656]